MPIGPHCAVADVEANGGTVYVQAQALQALPGNLAGIIGTVTGKTPPAENVRVVWYEGASSFGGGQTGEVTRRPSRCRQSSGSRCACSGCAGTSTAGTTTAWRNLWDVKMGADAKGNIVAADWTTYGQAQSNIDEMKRLLGTATWPAVPGTGGIAPSDSAVYNTASPRRTGGCSRRPSRCTAVP